MSSTADPSDPEARRGHLRRAIRRITTTFRRADGHTNGFDADIPGSISSESLAPPVEYGPSSMNTLTAAPSRLRDNPPIVESGDALLPAGPSQVHNAPLIAAPDSGDALIAASDVDLASLDPRFAVRDRFITGEWTLDRASAHNDRTQRLMSKYGVDIQPPDRASTNLPSVVHRVQRAPRMRIQRACHECGANFSQHKKCKACGHDICRRCPRAAGRRPESVMSNEGVPSHTAESSQLAEAEPSYGVEQLQTLTSDPISRASDTDSMQIAEEKRAATADKTEPVQQCQETSSQLLEDDAEKPGGCKWKGKGRLVESNSRMDLHPKSPALSPAEGPDLTSLEHSGRSTPLRFNFDMSPTTQLDILSNITSTIEVDDVPQKAISGPQALRMGAERQPLVDIATQGRENTAALLASTRAPRLGPGLINSDSPLQPDNEMADLPPSSLTCHARSGSSIHYLPSLGSAGPKERTLYPGLTSNGQPKMFPAVHRVFRKPRQRIRYMCHECDVPLLQAQTCSKCGHQRCELCRRRPTLKVRRDPDPRYVEAVERRLATMHQPMTSAAEHARAAQTAVPA